MLVLIIMYIISIRANFYDTNFITACQDGVLYLAEFKLLDQPMQLCCTSLVSHLMQEFMSQRFPVWPHTSMAVHCVSHL